MRRFRQTVMGGGLGLLALAGPGGCNVYTEDLIQAVDGASSGGNGSGGTDPGSGGGGATGGAGTGGSSTGGLGGGGNELELIDDLEDGNVAIKASNGRVGHWDIASDGTGTQLPSPFDIEDGTGAPASDYAAYAKVSGFTDWASLNVSMRNNFEEYDARAYSGLSFRAKLGAGSDTTVRVRVVTADTDQHGTVCSIPGVTVETTDDCYDHFFSEFDFTEEWDTYEVTFADLYQTGGGMSFDAVNLEKVYQFEFYLGASEIELYVDDVYFIKN